MNIKRILKPLTFNLCCAILTLKKERKMKKDKKGISTCPAGKEQYTVFWKKGEQKVQYDYRDKDGELFSCIENTLDYAREAKNIWLCNKKHKNDKQYKLNDVVLYPDEGGDLVPVVMKDGIACTLSQKGLEKFLSEALQKLRAKTL